MRGSDSRLRGSVGWVSLCLLGACAQTSPVEGLPEAGGAGTGTQSALDATATQADPADGAATNVGPATDDASQSLPDASQADAAQVVDAGTSVAMDGAPTDASLEAAAFPWPDGAIHFEPFDVEEFKATVVERLSGEHRVPYDFQPWWQAYEDRSTGELQMGIEVHSMQTRGQGFQLDATISLQDLGGRFDTTHRHTLTFSPVPDGIEVESYGISAVFEDAALAEQLELPPPVAATGTSDPFRLGISLSRDDIRVTLASRRDGSTCPLLNSPRTAPCGAASMYGPPNDAHTHEVPADTLLAGGVTPLSGVAALQGLAPLAVEWPDGTKARLEVDIEASNTACVRRLAALMEPDGYDAEEFGPWPSSGRSYYEARVPVVFHLRSDDGRLDVGVPGDVSLSLFSDMPWNRQVKGVAGMSPVDRLPQGTRPGFALDPSDLHMLLMVLRSPLGESGGSLSMTGWDTHAGLPAFPDVHESASNRASCFGTRGERAEAKISFY